MPKWFLIAASIGVALMFVGLGFACEELTSIYRGPEECSQRLSTTPGANSSSWDGDGKCVIEHNDGRTETFYP